MVLDDDRLYRKTEAPIPPTPKKAKAKAKPKARKSRGTRSSKRQKLLEEPEDEEEQDGEADEQPVEIKQEAPVEDDGFGGMTWECVAVTFEDYQTFLESIRRSKDADEKALHKTITEDIMPTIEKRAESQRQKALKKQRELENLQKLATAKRSGRLAEKQERQRQVEEVEAAEKKHREDLAMAQKEHKKQQEMEEVSQLVMCSVELSLTTL